MANEDDLLGSENFKDYEDVEELDRAAEEALLAASDDEGAYPVFYENVDYGEDDRPKQDETYGSAPDDDVLDLELDADAEFDTLNISSKSLLNVQEADDRQNISGIQDLTVHKDNDDKLLSSDSEDDDDCGRGRFTRERKQITPVPISQRKAAIPDSLDAVVPREALRSVLPDNSYRGRNNSHRGGQQRGGRGFGHSRDVRRPNQHGFNAHQRPLMSGNTYPRPLMGNHEPPLRHDHMPNHPSRPKVHVNPLFAQPPVSQSSGHSWDGNNRPLIPVPPLHQDPYKTAQHGSLMPPVFGNKPALLGRNTQQLMPDPNPYMRDKNMYNLQQQNNLRAMPNDPGCIQKPLSVALLTGAGLSMPSPNLQQQNFSAVQSYPQQASYLQHENNRPYDAPGSLYNMGHEQQRNYQTPQDLMNREQSMFSRQEPLLFNSPMDNWKTPPSQIGQNNPYPFQASGTSAIENIHPNNVPSASAASYQQQQQPAPGVLPMWQNHPPSLAQSLPFSSQQHLPSQHLLHQQQQQQQHQHQQQQLRIPPLQPQQQPPPFGISTPKHNPPNFFPSLQIRPEIRQTSLSSQHQPTPLFRSKPPQNLLRSTGHYSNYSSESNIKMNANVNKTHTKVGGVLTVINPLPEHAINALAKQAATADRFPRSNVQQPINVVSNRKRESKDVSAASPRKTAKLDTSPILNKLVTQNKSNIKEIQLVDISPVQMNVDYKLEPRTASSFAPADVPVINAEPVKATLPPEDEKDEQTRLLRQKIEEQKKQREEFLRRKEMRRERMAEQRRKELEERKLKQTQETLGDAEQEFINKIPVNVPSVKQRLKVNVGAPLELNSGALTKLGNTMTAVKIQPSTEPLKIANQPKAQPNVRNDTGQLQQLGQLSTQQQHPKGSIVNRLGPTANIRMNVPQLRNPNMNISPRGPNSTVRPFQRFPPGLRNNIRGPALPQPARLVSHNPNSNAVHAMQSNRNNRTVFQPGGAPLIKGKSLLGPQFPTVAGQRNVVNNLQANAGIQRTLLNTSAVRPMERGAGLQQQIRPQGVRAGVPKALSGGTQRRVVATPRNVVSIENLATSTTEAQLRKMCEEVGMIESIEYNQVQRTAVVKFQNAVAAEEFVKKYQRRMVDLSLITSKIM